MRTRLMASATTIALSGAMLFGVAAPSSAAAPAAPTAVTQAQQLASATGTITNLPLIDATGTTVGSFTGSFTPTSFKVVNGALQVTGQLVGTATRLSDQATEDVNKTITTTVQSATANQPACDILNLVLGPLHLNVLGLVVDLNQVVLNITAQPGSGNLLGNLLCAVAGLLDGNNLSGLGTLLNRLLGL
ncbi:hypothetical protein [Arthrobacter sp. Soil764]|uniref:hypothetical protein n=1 Tax=Arthrobacter sp. Soil764 TaxID=1736403 RepID=UPI0006F8DEF2|nr:hypothetical protein [Arthrobacter sp. Soil764]KRE91841.1 ABC transporter substrate-binding protein [Arthrobacter sp. Soil764]